MHWLPEANGAAVRALIPELRAAARGLVDGSAFLPDELVRDALVLALRDLHRLPSGDDVRAWLLGMLGDCARATGEPSLVERAQQLGAVAFERG
jgi:hypothetical protein